MRTSQRIVVIGGVACGPKAAARARRRDPSARITIIDEGALVSYATCGLPYYVSGAVAKRNSLLVRSAADFKNVASIDVLLQTRIEAIDRAGHSVRLLSVPTGQTSTLEYDKLVIATGSNPVVPNLEGRQLNGIFSVKDVANADAILAWVTTAGVKKAVVVGAGLVGIEMAEVLKTRGLEVTIVEALDRILPGALDEEISAILARQLGRKGLALRLNERVLKFEGEEGRVRRVVTAGGTFDADVVIVAIGVRPNVALARSAGMVELAR